MDNIQLLLQAPVFSVQLLVDGVLVGAIFALAAYGMALVWGVMNIISRAPTPDSARCFCTAATSSSPTLNWWLSPWRC